MAYQEESFEVDTRDVATPVSSERVKALAERHQRAPARPQAALLGGSLLKKVASIASTDQAMHAEVPEDGVDVINVGSNATTPVGKMLSINTLFDFNLEGYGKFRCVGGFYNWLRSGKEDRFRRLYGPQCQSAGRTIKRTHSNMPDPMWRVLVLIATWMKVNSSQENRILMAETGDLPFRDFYIAEGTQIAKDTPMSYWYAEGLAEIRRVVINNLKADIGADAEEPNFDTLPGMKPPTYDASHEGESFRPRKRH